MPTKFQVAHNALLNDHFGEARDDGSAGLKRLPETLTSLHARNIAFQEALRRERERAVKIKQAADAIEAAKRANKKVKDERLAKQREARARLLEQGAARRDKKLQQKEQQRVQRCARTAEKNGEGLKALKTAKDQPLLDWEQKEDRLEAEAEYRRAVIVEKKRQIFLLKPRSDRDPPRNTPTAATARLLWDYDFDERLVPDDEIKGRWDKKLLGGGRSGSVSFSQKRQKAYTAAARTHKRTLALCEEADRMLKPALTGNRTFSALVEDKLMEEAFIGMEAKAEARTDRILRLMDRDVVEQYLREDAEQLLRSIELGALIME
ncbi:hypothetical protein LTR37_011488 [Vermiconidia calcicola]|uniref:Uncharacterized protein n=1 Tax=Vermiconidia calcicola TaxID=1690605 RepID=A0ACC3N283_9PEZI|nr:hypothetical protein LTR37_011488 [Vermiconidia calcicola]